MLLHTFLFFFFNDTATTEIYTLSLHDALPISHYALKSVSPSRHRGCGHAWRGPNLVLRDRKSTRLNSSHLVISYAVFCLKKKKKLFTSALSQRQPSSDISTSTFITQLTSDSSS